MEFVNNEMCKRRISSRAVVVGVLSSLSLITVFMSLAAGLGIWSFDLHGYQVMNSGIWLFTFAATALFLYAGSFAAAQSSRSTSQRDGALHGFVTWAATNFLICLFVYSQIDDLLYSGVAQSFYMAAFLCEVIAASAALAGGSAGAKCERRSQETLAESEGIARARWNEAYL